jgi:hypothetical protein
VLSGDDDELKIDALVANLQAQYGDDAKGERASSVELIALGLIDPNASV